VSLLYGLAGTLNLADLSLRLRGSEAPGTVTAVSALFLAAFGIKAGAFPLFLWLPPAYPTPPAVVSALFAGLLTKVGVYALLRVFTLAFPMQGGAVQTLVLGAALLTMVTGVLGAVAQSEFRRVLSWHVISQVGYMLLGLGLLTELALAGTVFYLIHHIVVKANLFLVAGVVERRAGTGRLERLGGLYAARPALALLFLVPAMSLAGLPPLSGFWAKLLLVKAALDTQAWTSMALALVVGLLTLVSMTKLWAEAFWKAAPDSPAPAARGERAALAPIALLAAVTVAIGLGAGPVFELSRDAARQLLDPSAYVTAVLSGGR
jgi:multicomponent Na+:H+ antiporter subunit D